MPLSYLMPPNRSRCGQWLLRQRAENCFIPFRQFGRCPSEIRDMNIGQIALAASIPQHSGMRVIAVNNDFADHSELPEQQEQHALRTLRRIPVQRASHANTYGQREYKQQGEDDAIEMEQMHLVVAVPSRIDEHARQTNRPAPHLFLARRITERRQVAYPNTLFRELAHQFPAGVKRVIADADRSVLPLQIPHHRNIIVMMMPIAEQVVSQ